MMRSEDKLMVDDAVRVVAMKPFEAGSDGPRFLTSSPMSIALRRLSAEGGESGIQCPGDLLEKAADEIDSLRDALLWCSGSPSFADYGEAREGWMAIVA